MDIGHEQREKLYGSFQLPIMVSQIRIKCPSIRRNNLSYIQVFSLQNYKWLHAQRHLGSIIAMKYFKRKKIFSHYSLEQNNCFEIKSNTLYNNFKSSIDSEKENTEEQNAMKTLRESKLPVVLVQKLNIGEKDFLTYRVLTQNFLIFGFSNKNLKI
ncbi:hypothetical protein Avbf_08004 [Armadillidium vulgare]|nr:hypothetical protein Avbf_08004 [Armadillidium vulgare]